MYRREREIQATDEGGLWMKRIAITACPYSGTAHIVLTLQKLGLDIGHERYGADGIVSWQHVHMGRSDFIADGFPEDMLLLHQVRHPLMVISSLRQLHKSYKHPRTGANLWHTIKDITKAMNTPWDIENALIPLDKRKGLKVWMQLWYWWNKVGILKANSVYRIEELPEIWSWFLDLCDIEYAPQPFIRKDANRHRTPQVQSWDTLYAEDPELTLNIIELAEYLGYEQTPTDYLDDPFYEFPDRIELSCQ